MVLLPCGDERALALNLAVQVREERLAELVDALALKPREFRLDELGLGVKVGDGIAGASLGLGGECQYAAI